MKTKPEDTAMAKAWQKAGRVLGVEFISPFRFKSSSGREFVCAGFLPHFGNPNGTVIFSRFDFKTDKEWDEADHTVDELGYYHSGLSPYYYEKYDRSHVMETLNDWGWFGPEDKVPKWFTGGIRRHGGPPTTT